MIRGLGWEGEIEMDFLAILEGCVLKIRFKENKEMGISYTQFWGLILMTTEIVTLTLFLGNK